MTIFIMELFEIVLYLFLLVCAVYLVVATKGQRRWLMMIFVFSFGVDFFIGLLAIAGYIDYGVAAPLVRYLSHCASSGFVALLAFDRYLFMTGWGSRIEKEIKKKVNTDVGISASG